MEEVQEKTKWNELRNKLNNDYTYSEDWELAIQLFNRRIENKFFNPIQEIINTKKLKGEGFTIVTAQCGLIESLAAFRKGKIFNHSKNAASPQYEYKKSAEIFVDFLQNQDIFKNNFYQIEPNGDKTLNVPFSAKDFYQDVRCGLLHEARTKNNWVINELRK